jgi:2-polyprenyl-3-methyl-5-hydroxy-6-metoxy-1,4-benzoquinol methylase
MRIRKDQLNKLFWDNYSTEFDAIYGTKNSWFNNIINLMFRSTMKIRFEKSIMAIPEEKVSVLDIGCGPGHYCFSLAQNGQREILGIDFSEKMIHLANHHAKELGIEKNVVFEVVDFLDYKPDQKFDYSIMMGFIEYFENPESILRKALDITNQKIFISFPVAGGLLAFQRKLRYKSRCYLRLYSYEDIEKLLRELNINSYTIEQIQRDFFVTICLNK